MENIINVPRPLHEVHGERASLVDVILPHSLSILASIYFLMIPPGADFGLLKSVLLFVLTYDLIGGVIANFSEGTSRFYAESKSRRFKFIALHILQPTAMWYLFQDHQTVVLITSIYVVGAAIVVNQLKGLRRQLVVSGTLVIIGIFLFQLFNENAPLTLQFLLLAFILKLPLAWAVRWYS
ncbi:MAG: hypothetical protein AAFR66_02425 [Bacteroidota bacterium]